MAGLAALLPLAAASRGGGAGRPGRRPHPRTCAGRASRRRSRAGIAIPTAPASLVFGYFNRNYGERLDIPVGPGNRFEPGPADRGAAHPLPAAAADGGVFAVVVPAGFEGRLTWALTAYGETIAIPGHVRPEWEIDALEEVTSGNRPPVLRFGSPDGRAGAGAVRGPVVGAGGRVRTGGDHGLGGPTTASARRGRPGGRPVSDWSGASTAGPARWSFDNTEPEVGEAGRAVTTVTFDTPGRYVPARARVGRLGGDRPRSWPAASSAAGPTAYVDGRRRGVGVRAVERRGRREGWAAGGAAGGDHGRDPAARRTPPPVHRRIVGMASARFGFGDHRPRAGGPSERIEIPGDRGRPAPRARADRRHPARSRGAGTPARPRAGGPLENDSEHAWRQTMTQIKGCRFCAARTVPPPRFALAAGAAGAQDGGRHLQPATWPPSSSGAARVAHRPGEMGADVADHLRGGASVGARHPGQGGRAVDAALASRQDRRHPGLRERQLAERRRDRHHRAVGSTPAAPRGNPADLPPSIDWPEEDVWRPRRPLRAASRTSWSVSDPWTQTAEGQDQWWQPILETGLTEDRWVTGIEVRPSERRITHHSVVYLQQEEQPGDHEAAVDVPGRGSYLTEFAGGQDRRRVPRETPAS